MTRNLISTDVDGATAIITIARPEALNALSLAVEAEPRRRRAELQAQTSAKTGPGRPH